MGSPENEADRTTDEVQHQVQITRGFWLAETACTQNLWKAIMGSNPSNFKGPDLPVESVSHDDVMVFLTRLTERTDGSLFRLPTEAEWEYACRAGSTKAYHFGNKINAYQANFGRNLGKTAEVKTYPPNDWGLFQMHGNVWEWCADRYRVYDRSSVQDLSGPDTGTGRVLRGGSWINDGGCVRSAYRYRFGPAYLNANIGFRLARGQTP